MTEPQSTHDGKPPALHSLQGKSAPDPVVEGWAQVLAMQTSARQAFIELLSRSVIDPDEATLSRVLSKFCGGHGTDQRDAYSALKACQFLLQGAAALDLPPERFMEDLHRLSPSNDLGGVRLLGSRYIPLKKRIREALLVQALADHGKVLVDLDWRIDSVTSSNHALAHDASVVYLTLQTRDAEGEERVTLQLTAQSIQMLRQFCRRFSHGP